MSFITRCPSCGTAFKVVADQLKIADGWVRCGQCQQVFDATLDLQPVPPPAPATSVAPETASVGEMGSRSPAATTEPRAEAQAVSVNADHDQAAGDADARAAATPTTPPVALAYDEPSFVRKARRQAFWRRPVVRAVLGLLSLLLSALLAAQVAWHWRDVWAARYPASRPWLTAFCAHLGCTIAAPRRPQDVVIEGSVLLRRAPDRYSLHLVVRNNADIEVAAPALELTLTDMQDQVLVRRVWTPDAWPQPIAQLPPGAEWPLQFELAFDHPQAARMTGYRAVLFYP